MDFVRMILENIFSENSPKYIKIFKANEINDESIKSLTVEDFDALIPDDEEARDKIIGEPKPGQVSKFKKSLSAVQLNQDDSNSSDSELELLPKRTKKDDNGAGSNGGNNGIQDHKVPQEILRKRIIENKTQYLVKWSGKKKLLTWECSFDKKLENYQYMIRRFEREQEKAGVNDDCSIVDEEGSGPSGSRSKSKRNGNHDQGSREKIDENYNNFGDFGDDGDTAYIVEAILDKRKAGRRWEFYIKWQGYPESDNTWEPRTSLKECQEMLKAFEAVWKANNNENQADRNGNETPNSNSRQSQSQNHRNREENDTRRDDNQPKISKTLEERRENRKVNSFYKSLKLVSAQDESIHQARANSNAIPAIRRPKAWPKTSGHRLGGATSTTATVTNKNKKDAGNQPKKKIYKNIMDLSSSSTSDSDGDDNEINRKINKKKSKVKFSSNTKNANSDSASATQNTNGSNSNHHENENNYSPNSAMINGAVGVVEFPMFEDSSTSDDEFELEDDESPFVSVIKTENNPDDEPVVVPDIYSNLTMDYQNLDDDSN